MVAEKGLSETADDGREALELMGAQPFVIFRFGFFQFHKMNAQGPRVLVIDDEQDLRELVAAGLASYGYRVVTAKDGEEGLNRLQEEAFDVVVCDLVMPGMDGTEVVERLQEIDSSVPVLLFTGFPTIETAVRAMKRGAYDYVAKPLRFEDLDMRLKRCLDARTAREAARSARMLSFGLLISIPLWIILGLALALFFK